MTTKERIAVLEEKIEYLYKRILKLEHPTSVPPPKPNPFADSDRH